MSDPVLVLVLLAAFAGAAAAVRWFKTLDTDFSRAAATPLLTGLVAGVLLRFVDHAAVTGILLTLAALYVRLNGEESEPSEGMLMGALTGAAATVPMLFGTGDECLVLTRNLLSGAVAGYGITIASLYVADRGRQILLDAVTAAVAIGAAALPAFVSLPSREKALIATAAVPLLVIVAAFKQWRDVKQELRDEAAHGFVDEEDIRATSNPILRLGSGGWENTQAHRAFVRFATGLALRKRRQKHRSDEAARLYQLEIIKLRMQMREMTSIDRQARAAAVNTDSGSEQSSSDTIRQATER